MYQSQDDNGNLMILNDKIFQKTLHDRSLKEGKSISIFRYRNFKDYFLKNIKMKRGLDGEFESTVANFKFSQLLFFFQFFYSK